MKALFRVLRTALPTTLLAACGGSAPLDVVMTPTPPTSATPRCAPYAGPPLSALRHYTGTLHAHSSYSDGDIHTVPADYYRQIRDAGYAFAGGKGPQHQRRDRAIPVPHQLLSSKLR